MPFVADALITLAWAFDEVHPRAVLARERLRTDEAVRPEPVVVRAAQWLVMGERRGRLTEGDTAIFLRSIGRLAVTVDGVPDETAVLTLAPLSVDGLRCRVSRAGAERNSAASNLGWRASQVLHKARKWHRSAMALRKPFNSLLGGLGNLLDAFLRDQRLNSLSVVPEWSKFALPGYFPVEQGSQRWGGRASH